jgi:hypothetical protein
MRSLRKSLAVTLVSLLIGLALGAFLIVTMLQIFGTTQANRQLANNLAEVNDVLRYASMVMSNVIKQAGYRTPDASTGMLPAYTTAFTPFTGGISGYNQSQTNANDPAGIVLSYFPGQNIIQNSGGVDPLDKLWVKFYGNPNGEIRDCNDLYGNTAAAIRVQFYSREITVDGTPQTAFYCERHDNGSSYSYDTTTAVGTELIPAALFDSAWVRYGEDITEDGYIARWITGDQVQDRNRVYAVRVAFLVHTRDQVRSNAVSESFSVFGNTITRNDRYIYKLYMFTVLLPNAPNFVLEDLVTTP